MAFQGDSIFWVEVEKIVANPYQPRREFDEDRLKELAESVRMYGILQPLTVTRKEIQNGDGSFRSEYELIAGERRLRASKLAGLSLVPVIIRDGEQSEQEKLELAIIENLQREDLNAVDRALAFRQLADVFGLSHGQVAQKVGRSREYVSNSIRLLALPDYMLNSLRLGDITEGHARTLLMLNDRPEEQDTVFRETLLKKLSVRELERIARGIATEKVRNRERIDDSLLDLERKFTETLGTRVSIVKTDFGGKMTIDYFSAEDLVAILERIKSEGGMNMGGVRSLEHAESVDMSQLEAATPLLGSSHDSAVPLIHMPVPPEAVVPMTVAPVTDTSTDILLPPPIAQPNPEREPTVANDMPAAPITTVAHNAVNESERRHSVPDSPLRSKLASLLKRPSPAEPIVVATPASYPVMSPRDAAPVTPPVNSVADTDSDLYSVKSFTI